MGMTKRRLEMGEERWAQYQVERKREKAKAFYRKHCVTSWRVNIKKMLMEYKGGKCEACGYDKPIPRAFDFHHRDPKKKSFSISSYGRLNRKDMLEEADKCVMVCKNCHAEIHHNLDSEGREERKKSYEENRRVFLSMKKCDYCDKKFKPKAVKQRFCSHKCYSLSRTSKNKPSREELDLLVGTMTMVAIGERFGVSNNAVKKWAKQYRII